MLTLYAQLMVDVVFVQEVGQLMTAGKTSIVGVADLNKNQLEQLYDCAHVSIQCNMYATMVTIVG